MARLLLPRPLVALTVMPPLEVSVAPLPTDASVWNLTTSTPIDPDTLAWDRPPAAAMPQMMKSFSPLGTIASIVMPAPVRRAAGLTDAVLVASA
jgi:hypothetical protein